MASRALGLLVQVTLQTEHKSSAGSCCCCCCYCCFCLAPIELNCCGNWFGEWTSISQRAARSRWPIHWRPVARPLFFCPLTAAATSSLLAPRARRQLPEVEMQIARSVQPSSSSSSYSNLNCNLAALIQSNWMSRSALLSRVINEWNLTSLYALFVCQSAFQMNEPRCDVMLTMFASLHNHGS